MSLALKTPFDVVLEVAERAKSVRLSQNESQMGLSRRSGVPLPTLRKFERTGKISFESLARIALALGAMSDFDVIFANGPKTNITLDQILMEPKLRKRGRGK